MINLGLVNIFNEGRNLFLFHRTGQKLNIMQEKTFFPYMYNPSPTGVYLGYLGKKYNKVIVKEPFLIPKQRTVDSAEADVIYTRRYMIDKLNVMKSQLRYVFFDIETQSVSFPDPMIAPDPITCITTYDNYTQEYQTFWIKDYQTESDLLDNFVRYIREIQPDLMLGWNALGFDFPYLVNRYQDFAMKISPIDRVVNKNGFPAGLAMIDYMDWVKKVYKYKKNSLEYVYCDTFKLHYNPLKYDFGSVNDEIKDKNKADVRKMVELEAKLRLIPYFDELRRIAKAQWEDLTHYSVLVDCFMLQIAKEKGRILPSKPDEDEKLRREEESDITGGYVYAKTGVYKGVHLFDVGGTYPNLILTFNLDPANVRAGESATTTKIRSVYIHQQSDAIIPTLCAKLIHSRQEIQKQLETVTGEEAELLKKKDEAHKSLNNSVYGITLFKSSRLYSKDIAGSITYLARFLIRYTKWFLRHSGIEVVQSDTDSIFVKTELPYKDIENTINTVIIPRWLKHFGKTTGTLKFKYEGTFKDLFVLTKKRYIGNFVKANGEAKLVKKGIEVVRSDATKFQETFQEALLSKILKAESKEAVSAFVLENIKLLRTAPLNDVAFPCKLSQRIEDYKTTFNRKCKDVDGSTIIKTFDKDVPIHVRALRNSKLEKRVGEDYYWIYINSEDPKLNVIAFDDFSQFTPENQYDINWKEMEKRNIWNKVEDVFEAMGWDIKEVKNSCLK